MQPEAEPLELYCVHTGLVHASLGGTDRVLNCDVAATRATRNWHAFGEGPEGVKFSSLASPLVGGVGHTGKIVTGT